MTALLPAISLSPFTSRFDPTSYAASKGLTRYVPALDGPVTSVNATSNSRGAKPTSQSAANPAVTAPDDENSVPSPISVSRSVAVKSRAITHEEAKRLLADDDGAKTRYRNHSFGRVVYPSDSASKVKTLSHQNRFIPCPRRARAIAKANNSSTPLTGDRQQSSKPIRKVTTPTRRGAELNRNVQLEPFPALSLNEPVTPQARRIAHHQRVDAYSPSDRLSPAEPPSTSVRHRSYHQRLSEASSVFVHTIKTASISNGSISIVPQSLRMIRSTDSQTFGSHFRHSMDSERPPTSSIDEAAFLRGVRRKQILDELLATEESYVSDLKALVYLYSTLLASALSISPSTRSSIQRNVTGLLHLHEKLVSKLHQARFRAAARRWADTASPFRIGIGHHVRWRSADATIQDNHFGRHRRTRSSVGSAHVIKQLQRLGTADPVDILDVAAIFQCSLSSLFIYEDYCANHEVVASELQKQTPDLWSTYEAGMESLARVLTAIDQKAHQERKGLTVRDLLIKPIQRICKYPLLLDDLLRHTPVADGPAAHEAVESVLHRIREIVQAVNVATDNHFARVQIQRRWLLQDRLNLQPTGISTDAFRELGQPHLCGVLFLTYQTAVAIDGCYAMCVLLDSHLIIALQGRVSGKFDVFAILNLCDLKIESAGDGRGLQCQSAFHTFKVCFVANHSMYEILLSACSPTEEEQWLFGLNGRLQPESLSYTPFPNFSTQVFVDLKAVGKVYNPTAPLVRQLSIQRAATVGTRSGICHVIIRNTHNPQDLQEYRTSTPHFISRSLSHASTSKVTVLAPKRTERTKLEASLSDVWTKDRLPFPGMFANRGTQILRASAGSLVRKLSLASIQTPFSRRSASATVSSKKSYEALSDHKPEVSTFEIRHESFDDPIPIRSNRPAEVPELDTMDSVIGRMIGGNSTRHKRLSFSGGEKLPRGATKDSQRPSLRHVGPEDPAAVFYEDGGRAEEAVKTMDKTIEAGQKDRIEERLGKSSRRKRWSNPISMLKGLGSEGIRNMLHSTR